MPDPATTSSSQTSIDIATEEQAKALHAQLNKFYRSRRKTRKAKPVLRPMGKVNVIQRNITVEESATDWESITDEIFSLDVNATQLFIKTGKERARNLTTGKTIAVGGASVHKCFI